MANFLASQYGTLLASFHYNNNPIQLYAFPSVLELVEKSNEDELRQNKFGYRAKYIVESARRLDEFGGEVWLESLKLMSRSDANDCLIQLSGVGRKVASCVSLLSLNHYDEIPVDTHVWSFTKKYYMKEQFKKSKNVTEKSALMIGNYYRELFGEYAGWAHNILFASDLKEYRDRVNAVAEEDVKEEEIPVKVEVKQDETQVGVSVKQEDVQREYSMKLGFRSVKRARRNASKTSD